MYGQLGTAAIIWSRWDMDFPFPETVTLLYLRGLYPSRRFDICLGAKFFNDWLSFLDASLSKGPDENLEILQYELRIALDKAQLSELLNITNLCLCWQEVFLVSIE